MAKSTLRAAATKAKTTKKSSTPSVTASEAVGQAIKDFKAAKQAEKKAKADLAEAEARMNPEAKRLREKQCLADGEVHASVRLVAGDDSIMHTQKNQCKKMDEDCEDPIRALLGDEKKFDEWFTVGTNFSFDEAALLALPNSEEVVHAIMSALGPNVDILTATTVVTPKPKFFRDAIFDTKSKAVIERLQAEGFAQPYKPSYR